MRLKNECWRAMWIRGYAIPHNSKIPKRDKERWPRMWPWAFGSSIPVNNIRFIESLSRIYDCYCFFPARTCPWSMARLFDNKDYSLPPGAQILHAKLWKNHTLKWNKIVSNAQFFFFFWFLFPSFCYIEICAKHMNYECVPSILKIEQLLFFVKKSRSFIDVEEWVLHIKPFICIFSISEWFITSSRIIPSTAALPLPSSSCDCGHFALAHMPILFGHD